MLKKIFAGLGALIIVSVFPVHTEAKENILWAQGLS